jgi:uncharacterized protein (DUF1501 family)
MNRIHMTPRESLTVLDAQTRWPGWMPRLAFSPKSAGPAGDLLVVVFLRGAADMLNMVVPHGEEAYYRLRPSLGVPRPDDSGVSKGKRALDLDGFFGLHPAMESLLPVWQAGELAIVHACGAPDESRSHFKAMELMERGAEDERGPASGWLGRHLASLENGNTSPLRAVGLGELAPRSLYGPVPVATLRSISDYHLQGSPQQLKLFQASLEAMYNGSNGDAASSRETLALLQKLQNMEAQGYLPRQEAAYPESEFGMGLKQVAALAKADLGLEAAALDLGGWDTHFAQGSVEGLMPRLMQDLAQGLSAFYSDMTDHRDRLSIVVMTEFGRRAYDNASLGTDHGHGALMMLLGGGVHGGKVHGHWPGMERDQLFGPGDLAVTTDYRDVLGEVCLKRLNNPNLAAVFPGYSVRVGEILKPR